MKTTGIAMLFGLLLATATSASLAQDTTSSGKSKTQERTITGCLTQGSSSNSYVLKGNDGSTWDLKGDKVALADHVGHTVTVKGTVSHVIMHNAKEEAKDAAAGGGVKKTNDEDGDLEVASLRMVSKSCK
ncbi:MAG: hypothetical protein WAK48_15120 [Candidatus Acidiferrum sp.]|jgi:hypothetical protein